MGVHNQYKLPVIRTFIPVRVTHGPNNIAHAGRTAFTLHTGRYLHCTHWTAFTHGPITTYFAHYGRTTLHTRAEQHWHCNWWPVFIYGLRSTLHHTQAKQHCTLFGRTHYTRAEQHIHSTQAEKHIKESIHVFSFCKAEWNTGICCSKVNTGID